MFQFVIFSFKHRRKVTIHISDKYYRGNDDSND